MNRALTAVVGLVAKRGPDALRWAGVAAPLLTDAANRERLAALTQRLRDARYARTPDARLEGEVSALHDAASSALEDAQDDAERERAATWLRRTNTLRSSLRLVASTQGATRRRGLEQLAGQVDRLREEVLAATLGADEAPAAPPADEGPPS